MQLDHQPSQQVDEITEPGQQVEKLSPIDQIDKMFHRVIKVSSKDQTNIFEINYVLQTGQVHPVESNKSPCPHQNKKQANPAVKYGLDRETTNPPNIQQSQKSTHKMEKKHKQQNQKKPKRELSMREQDYQTYKKFNAVNRKRINIGLMNPFDNFHYSTSNKNDRRNKYGRKKPKRQFDSVDEFDGFQGVFELFPKKSRSIDYKSRKEVEPFLKKKKKALYQPYTNINEIELSRENNQGRYFRGYVDFAEHMKYIARISTKEVEGECIAEKRNQNRCLHGDQVYFEIIHNPTGTSEKINCRVVAVLPWKNKGNRQIVGKIELRKDKNTLYLVPINKRINTLDIKFSEISQQDIKKVNQQYFLAEYIGWEQNQQYPSCRIISEYGELGSIQTETGALLINNGVQDVDYDQDIVDEALEKFLEHCDENGEYQIPQEQVLQRSDLRKQRIFTIDPLTARDFDDALSIQQCGERNGEKVYEIGVHIADASYFVEEGSAVDQIAQKKTTSVYLVHRVISMLPRVLCETMCSLNPGLDRLTVSVWFKVTDSGQILPNCRYDRSVIHSCARFTYEQAQQIINGQTSSQQQIEIGFGCTNAQDFPQIAEDIKTLNSIAMKMRQKRIDGGSLIFQIPKKTFKLTENLYPDSYTINKRFQANFLVEEYMLLANQKVGEVLIQHIRPQALLRRHKFPGPKKIVKFEKFAKMISQDIKITKQVKIQEQLNQVMNDPKVKQCVKDILNYELIFLLEMAEYFVVANSPQESWLHYALNMPVYTHFTSPIRRYPDIIVHRQLCAIIRAKKINEMAVVPHPKNLKDLVDRCNQNKMSAKKVSSGCEKIFLCLYLKKNPVDCKAVLTDLNQHSLSICVPSYDFRSSIELKDLKKIKVLEAGTNDAQRKFLKLDFEQSKGIYTKIYLKQMQQVLIRLTAKQGFPIDYLIRLNFPNPKQPNTFITIE